MERLETYGEWRKRRDRQEFWTSNFVAFVIAVPLALLMGTASVVLLFRGWWLSAFALAGVAGFMLLLLLIVQNVLRVWWKL